MTVEIIRFKDGLDVVANTIYENETVQLKDPMIFQLKNQSLLLQQWLPLSIIKNNFVVIDRKEILCSMDPSDEFAKYYTDAIIEMQKEDSDFIKKDKEQNMDILEACAELALIKDNINIH